MLTLGAQDKLEALTQTLSTSYPSSKFVYKALDIADFDAVDSAVASAVKEVGEIDILINNVRNPSPVRWIRSV
jgi:3-hydroxy acid dehydrogenase / malonic semialdehyde reductase